MNINETTSLDHAIESEEEKIFFRDLENRLKRGIDAPCIVSHESVISYLNAKYTLELPARGELVEP